ncbi:MAG TPA: Mov34/MPN/PAD-1 family protein, partial [Kofleriaceae bacterium]
MSSLDVRSIDDKQLRKQASPAVVHEFRVFLSEAAFDRAVARGDGDVTREIGGVLVGELLRDDAGPYLWIDATIDALHAEEKGAELTFTHATWEHIHKEMDGKHQNKKVVGWYHTHPGFGVFLSDRDQFIHKSFFNLPFQVAFVYDPKTHEHGMFTWHDNEVWRARRYWIGSREQVWDGPRAPVDKQAREPEAEKRKPEADRDDGSARRAQDDSLQGGTPGMFVVIGVVLLLLGGIVGHWLGTRSTGQVVEEAQRAIELAKQEGAQRAIASLQGDLVTRLRDTIG